jgi:ketosteroid isomerase-like protein
MVLICCLLLPHLARGQQQQGDRAPSVPPAIKAEVLTFVRSYIDAENRADATALSDAMSRRADVTSVGDGNITRGWDAIRAQTDQITGKQGMFRLDVGTMDVVPLGTSYVLVLAPTTTTVNTQRGAEQLTGEMTLVLEKGKDGWKILNEHYSTKRQ